VVEHSKFEGYMMSNEDKYQNLFRQNSDVVFAVF